MIPARRPAQYRCRACLASGASRARDVGRRRPARARPRPAELSAGRPHLDPPRRADARGGAAARRALRLASARRRGRPLEAPAAEDRRLRRRGLPLRRPPLPGLRQRVQRLNAAELDVFVGPDYLVTLPTVELLPVTRLFRRCEDDEAFREQLFSKGSGRLLYEVLDDLFDYCFPILDKIGHKLDSIEDDMFEGRSEEVVRDISNAKQEIISYRKIVKPERSTLRAARAPRRAVPARGARALLRRHRRRRRAHLGHPRQLQGGRRGARGDERVGHLAPPERRPAHPHRLQRRAAAADADHRLLRDERPLPRLRHDVWAFWAIVGLMVARARRAARVLPPQALALGAFAAAARKRRPTRSWNHDSKRQSGPRRSGAKRSTATSDDAVPRRPADRP